MASTARLPPPDLVLYLAFLSGFVDTAVFIHMKGLFVAHVTGNLVLMGAALAGGGAASGHGGVVWVQLAAFPAFFAMASLAALLERAMGEARILPALLWIATVLIAALAVAALFDPSGQFDVPISLGLAGAMGMLNAAHRLVPALGPPFTVMTGNVTALAVALAQRLGRSGSDAHATALPSAVQRSVLLFALGCALGAVAVAWSGLPSVLIPAMLLAARLKI